MPTAKPLKQKPAFQRLKKLVDQPGKKDLLWYHRVGREVALLCSIGDRKYGDSQIAKLAEAIGGSISANTLWKARQFNATYDREEVKVLSKPMEGSRFQLTWWHAIYLLSLSDSDRPKLQKKCLRGEWSTKELRNRIKEHHGQKGKGGRKFEKPATLEDGLKQLISESEDWQRRFQQVWFNPDDPAIDWDSKTASTGAVAELCSDAVEVLESIQDGIQKQLPKLRSHSRAKKKMSGGRKGK